MSFASAVGALARGDLDAARAAFERSEPRTDAERLRWALVLLEVGDLERARALTAEITDPARRGAVEELFDDPAPSEPSEADRAEDELDRAELCRRRPGAEDAGVVEAFRRWFGGRSDLFSRQWYDARRRRGGYRPVRQPFTAEVARAHLAGRQTLGQYLLWPDATVSFAVIDLDLGASAVAELEAARGEGSALRHPGLRDYAARIRERGARLDVPLFVSDSGRRGAHLWVFFEPRRPARAARALLRHILEASGAPPADVSVEVFPKQDRHGPRGLSSLVKLPLGLHQATMRPCPLLDESLAPIEDAASALGRLRPVAPDRVDAILGRRLLSLPALPTPTSTQPAPELPDAPVPRNLAVALRGVPEGKGAREAAERMIDGCSILGTLVDAAFSRRALTPDQGRALIYSLGLVSRTPTLAVEVLGAAQVPMRELNRVRRGLPSPVGCRRLRDVGAAAGAKCARCPSMEGAQPYPTPALFAVGAVAPAPPRHAPFAAWLEPADTLAEDAYERLHGQVAGLDERLRRLEAPAGADGAPADESGT